MTRQDEGSGPEGYDKGGYDKGGYEKAGYDKGGYDKGGRDEPAKGPRGAGGGAHLPVTRFSTYRMHRLSTLLSRQMNDVLQARYNLNLAEWRTLAVLGDGGPLSLREVARTGAMDKAQVSRLLPRLIDRGLVARTTHPADRRRASLVLTGAGRTLFDEIYRLGVRRQAWLGTSLSAAEMARFETYLDRLLAQVEADPAGPFRDTEAA